MGQLVSDRVCYKHGVIKPENKMIELHAFCDCARCNYRKAYINSMHGVEWGKIRR